MESSFGSMKMNAPSECLRTPPSSAETARSRSPRAQKTAASSQSAPPGREALLGLTQDLLELTPFAHVGVDARQPGQA